MLFEATANELRQLWQWRRDHAADLLQPAAQWPDGRSSKSAGFNGYSPDTLQLAPKNEYGSRDPGAAVPRRGAGWSCSAAVDGLRLKLTAG